MLRERFEKYIRDHDLVGPGDRVLLTVSGGVDSMVMLRLFAESGYDIGVAHCNFMLRGPEAEEDEIAVENEALRLGVPFYNYRFDTRGEMERTGESVQIAARRLRYDWFAELCHSGKYTSIAIAHHADDSIETFFINLLRGTGLRGLTGIHQVRGRVIRPLLFASRREILDYAHTHGIAFREDSSNRSTKYLRNKIRLGIIPRLREIAPRFTEIMSGDIDRLTDAQLFITHSIKLLRERIETREGDHIIIDPRLIDPGFPIGFVIYELLNSSYGFRGDTVDALYRSLSAGTTGKRFYAKDYAAWTDRGRIVVGSITADDPCEVQVEERATKAYCGNSVLYLTRTDIDNLETLQVPADIALLDADRLRWPLTLRRWQEGDTFIPLGMTGHKKVSDLLIDEKVPMPEKSRQFVLLSDNRIAWVVGRRIDDRFKVTDETENILKITREIL